MIVLLVFLEYMFDAIRVIDQVSGPEKQAYPNDITVVPGHFQSKTQRVVPDVSRTPKQEMARRPWCHLVVRQFCFPVSLVSQAEASAAWTGATASAGLVSSRSMSKVISSLATRPPPANTMFQFRPQSLRFTLARRLNPAL